MRRFGIKSLFGAIALLALPCSWLGERASETTRRNNAIAAIQSAGGDVTQISHKLHWLGNHFAKYFRPPYIRAIRIGNRVQPNAWTQLRQSIATFPELERLDFSDSTIGDADLSVCKQLPKLLVLNLRRTGITDVGTRHLSSVDSLLYLDLGDTDVTDATASIIAQLPSLQYCNVGGTTLTIQGLEKIASNSSMRGIGANEMRFVCDQKSLELLMSFVSRYKHLFGYEEINWH